MKMQRTKQDLALILTCKLGLVGLKIVFFLLSGRVLRVIALIIVYFKRLSYIWKKQIGTWIIWFQGEWSESLLFAV